MRESRCTGRTACGLAIALAACAALAGTARETEARPAYSADATAGVTLHDHDADMRWHPASLTKLMTAYLALEAVAGGRLSMDSPVRLSATAVDQPVNTMGWPAGTEIDLATALRLLIVKSANDVAVAVAETVADDHGRFVAAMNAAAARLGMGNTRFVNANGLHDPGQYSSARDMARLAVALLAEFPAHQGLFAEREVTVRGQTHRSFNPLLGSYPGADGMKTGYVCEAGYNIVATVSTGGRRLVAVVLGALSEAERKARTEALLDRARERPSRAARATGTMRDGPFDMRPHACGGQPLPADHAPYGPGGG